MVIQKTLKSLYEQWKHWAIMHIWLRAECGCGPDRCIDAVGCEAQRIKGLSLTQAITDSLFKPKNKVKSLVDEFVYPRLGAGQLYEKMLAEILSRGGTILFGSSVRRIIAEGHTVRAIEVADIQGTKSIIDAKAFLASCPLTELIDMMRPVPPEEVQLAAKSLRYRHHIAVNLIVSGKTFPDNWLYIHSRDVRMARISNYRNFSSAMSSAQNVNPLTVEYFTFPGDGIWKMNEEALIALAAKELLHMKIITSRDQVCTGFIIRSEKAYPVIDRNASRHVAILKHYLDAFTNILPIGRSGMFKYNNQDHAIATGLLAARTLTGQGKFDPWLVNIDAEYHEEAAVYDSPR